MHILAVNRQISAVLSWMPPEEKRENIPDLFANHVLNPCVRDGILVEQWIRVVFLDNYPLNMRIAGFSVGNCHALLNSFFPSDRPSFSFAVDDQIAIQQVSIRIRHVPPQEVIRIRNRITPPLGFFKHTNYCTPC